MDFGKLANQIDDDMKEIIKQFKSEIEQSIWDTRKYVKGNNLSKSQRLEVKEIALGLIDATKEQWKDVDEDYVREFIDYLEGCKLRLEEVFK